MNIFLTSLSSKEAASHLDDLRLNKMILETAQLLSSSYRYLFKDDKSEQNYQYLYKVTHLNHPCSVWARKNVKNFRWLTNYFYQLNQEKILRTGKSHLSFDKLFTFFEYHYEPVELSLDDIDFNCTEFKEIKDPILAYRTQMVEKWNRDKRFPTWKNTCLPSFVIYLDQKFKLLNVSEYL